MKQTHLILVVLAVVLLMGAIHGHAQGTAFTYQGRLNDNGAPANGNYGMVFYLCETPDSGGQLANLGIVNVPVSNGLFTVTLDFGANFPGADRWLEITVQTNGAATFTALSPRQKLTPAPYAITASNLTGTLPAAQLSGTVGNGQLANSSITVTAGTGLSGGGTVALGGSTTLNNAGILSVTGNSDITASTVGGAVTLGDTATSANTAGTIVKRDGSGNFSARSVTLNGTLNLPATTATAGIIYSGGGTFVHAYGMQNIFAGQGAGNLTMAGSANTGIGAFALQNNASGGNNTANGAIALLSNTTGSNNTGNGWAALYANTSGGANTASGAQALQNNTTGGNNTANGASALGFNTTGINNTANGSHALQNNTIGGNNTGNGYAALYNNTNSNNTANGAYALYANTSGGVNTANGTSALYSNTTGDFNTAIGASALYSNTTGDFNTANGASALYSNTSGDFNTANGAQALYSNTTGFGNTANGAGALGNNTTGFGNTANGNEALLINTSGSDNIAVGDRAGDNLTTGSYNIDIGNPGAAGEGYTIRIGVQNLQVNTFIAGIYGASASGGAPVYVNSSGQLGTLPSSVKFKQDIQTMADASEVLLSLRPVTFHYKPEIDPKGLPQFGLVAEEVDKVNPALVVRDDQHGIYTVRYEAVNAMLLNEFLKQHRKVEEQNTEITMLKGKAAKVDSLEKRLGELEQIVQSLAEKK